MELDRWPVPPKKSPCRAVYETLAATRVFVDVVCEPEESSRTTVCHVGQMSAVPLAKTSSCVDRGCSS